MEKFDFNLWLEEISVKIKNTFKDNLLFIGYHGSYRRGEAADNSDIDMVVILDSMTFEDLKEYKKIVQSMLFPEKCCGFISGKKEIENWSKSDIFQLYYETKNIYGDIKVLITPPSKEDIKTAVKANSETLYHAVCHAFLYDRDPIESLKPLYKMIFFILQAKYFLKTGEYILTKKELLNNLTGTDENILKNAVSIPHNRPVEDLYSELISWASENCTK